MRKSPHFRFVPSPRLRVSGSRQLPVWLLAWTLCWAALPALGQKPLALVDILSLEEPRGARLSPDGSQVLFEISIADWKTNRRVSHIWRIPASGGEMLRMTNGSGETGPVWSPDGGRFAFLRRAGESNQAFVQRAGGGEAEQWTKHATAVSHLAWARDSSRLYFLAPEKLPSRGQDDAYVFEHSKPNNHLWEIPLADRKERRLSEGSFDVREFTVAPDGRGIFYVAAPSALLDATTQAEIYRLDPATGEKRRLTDNRVGENQVRVSPDGSQLLFLAPSDPALADVYYQHGAWVMPASGGAPRLLAPDFRGEIMAAEWSEQGVLLLASTGVDTRLYRLRPDSRSPQPLTPAGQTITEFHYAGGPDRWVAVVSDPASAGDLWAGGRLTHLNPQLRNAAAGRMTAYHWKAKDGTDLDGILVYPVGYQPGRRYPLVTQVHGGPQSSSKLTFSAYGTTYPQYWAGHGWLVFQPNHRGSSGYGNDFLRDMKGNYWRHSADDVLDGIDALIREGLADSDRLGMMGWSAGGHMTNWLITHTNRFKAASSGAGAANWISMFSESDIRSHRDFWFGGDPWGEKAPLESYLKQSPAFYAQRVTTPTLIMVGERDERVPMPQSVEMYRALKRNGATTELLIFPREGHGFQELRHRLTKATKEFGWFEKYVRGADYTPEPAPKSEDTDSVSKSDVISQ